MKLSEKLRQCEEGDCLYLEAWADEAAALEAELEELKAEIVRLEADAEFDIMDAYADVMRNAIKGETK